MRHTILPWSLALLCIAVVRVGYGAEPDEAKYVFPELKEMAKDARSDVRLSAAARLGLISSDARESKDAVAVLAGLLQDCDPQVQSAAAEALGHMGPVAKDSTWILTGLLQDRNWLVRSSAAQALAQIGPAAQNVVSGIISLLGDPQWDTRRQAADSLAGIGPAAGLAAIAGLEARLTDAEPPVRVSAAEALVRVHSNAGDAISALQRLRYDVHPGVRKALADILERINPEGIESLYRTPVVAKGDPPAAWTDLRQSVDNYLREAVVTDSNQDLVGGAKTIVEALKQLEDCDDKVRQADREATDADLHLKALAAVPVEVDLLADSDLHVRGSAAGALGYFGNVTQKTRERLDKADSLLSQAIDSFDQASRQLKSAGDQLEKAGKQQLNDADKKSLNNIKKGFEKAKQPLAETQTYLDRKKGEKQHKGHEAETQLVDSKTQMENAKAQLRTHMLYDCDWTVRQASFESLSMLRGIEKTTDAAKNVRP